MGVPEFLGLKLLLDTPFIRNPFDTADEEWAFAVAGRFLSMSPGSSNTPTGGSAAGGVVARLWLLAASETLPDMCLDSELLLVLPSPCFASLSILGRDFLNDGMLFLPELVIARLMVLSFAPDCCFSCLSISPAIVVPFVAKFSSGIDVNFTIPRSEGTDSMSAMNDWIRAAFLLFIIGPIWLGTVVTVRM